MASTLIDHDIAQDRERARRGRVVRLLLVVLVLEIWVVGREIAGLSVLPTLPAVDPLVLIPSLFFIALLVLMVGTMSNVFKEVITAGIFVKGGIDDGIMRHRRILDALKSRSADRAAHMMFAHLDQSEMNAITYIEEHTTPEPDSHAGTLHAIKKEELP